MTQVDSTQTLKLFVQLIVLWELLSHKSSAELNSARGKVAEVAFEGVHCILVGFRCLVRK